MISGWLSGIAMGGVGSPTVQPPFQFDRPAEHGLGARSFGESVFPATEAREAAVDGVRDAILAHFDPAWDVSRWAAGEQVVG